MKQAASSAGKEQMFQVYFEETLFQVGSSGNTSDLNRKCLVRVLAEIPKILTEGDFCDFCDFLLSLQANAYKGFLSRPQPLPSTFIIHCLPIIRRHIV
jgi:hypothetical protein